MLNIDEIWLSKSNTSDSVAGIISGTLGFQIVPNIKQITQKGESYLIQKSIFSGKATIATKLEATITNYCDRNDLLLELDELLVIEYYSRR